MPQNNEIVAALPTSGSADKELLRAWAVQRNSFNLRPEEDLRDFVMIDPDGGGTTPSVVQNGMLYGHDPDDVTTGHDGVYCLVSYDSQRYKLETGLHAPFNVLDKDLTAPPVSPAPSYGDAYLIYGSPTGAWAGKSGYIAIFTSRGWSFCLPPIGFLVYVRDEASYYHRDDLGAWVLGTGTRTLGNNSVLLSNAINFGKRLIVENQTTTSPPGTATVGTAYIIGPSATGAWAGKDGKIAICEVANTFTIYIPSNGWAAFDKAQNNEYRFNGTSWVSAAGVWVGRKSIFTLSGSAAGNGLTSLYVYSSSVAPTTSHRKVEDQAGLTFQAKKSEAPLRFRYNADYVPAGAGPIGSGFNIPMTLAIFRDSETSALAWRSLAMPPAGGVVSPCSVEFEITSNDAAQHTYKVMFMSGSLDTGQYLESLPGNIMRRLLSVEEAAQ